MGLVLMGGTMLSKSLIQFFVVGLLRGCVPSLLFDLRPNYGRCNVGNVDLLQKDLCMHYCIQCPDPGAGHVDPCLCERLLDTHRQVWHGLLWGYCSFLLAPGKHKVLFVPSYRFFPQCCVSSIINSHWPSKSNSLGVLSPFARSPGWVICCGS